MQIWLELVVSMAAGGMIDPVRSTQMRKTQKQGDKNTRVSNRYIPIGNVSRLFSDVYVCSESTSLTAPRFVVDDDSNDVVVGPRTLSERPDDRIHDPHWRRNSCKSGPSTCTDEPKVRRATCYATAHATGGTKDDISCGYRVFPLAI